MLATLLLATLASPASPPTDDAAFAKGRGGFTIRSATKGGEDVVAAVNFDIKTAADRQSQGWFTYSAEDHDHHRYPHVVLRIKQVTNIRYVGKTVYGEGLGEYHDEPAMIEFRAEDRSPAPDFIHVMVKQDGMVMYHRHSELSVGNIEVKP